MQAIIQRFNQFYIDLTNFRRLAYFPKFSYNNSIVSHEKGGFMFSKLNFKRVCLCIAGSGILAFGLYNIHALSGVTEGGILGMTLLLHHLFHLSPAISGFIMNAICYIIGWRLLGRSFVTYSILSGCCFSVFYGIFEQFPPLWPQLADLPFVGVGAGLCVRAGGAPSGDDALAMSICSVTKKDIRWAYLFSDLIVLVLSLTYLTLTKFALSLLTVLLSGQIIGIIQKIGKTPSATPATE